MLRNLGFFLLLGALGCATSPATKPQTMTPGAPSWTMQGGGPNRSSRSPYGAPADWGPNRIIKLFESGDYYSEEYATPIVIEDIAYVGHSGRAFEAVRLKNEELVWRVNTNGRIYTTAVYVDGLFIFGDDAGLVRAVSLAGEEVWRFQAPYPVVASPVAAEGKVFVPVADQNVFGLEAATGRPLWQYGKKFPRRNTVWRSLGLCYGNERVYAGFSDGTLVALDAEVGEVEWRAEVGAPVLLGDVVAGPAYWQGRVYVGAFGGPLACLDAETGSEMWRREVAVVAGFAVGDDMLYAGTVSGSLVAVSVEEGEVVWEAQLDGGLPTIPVFAAGIVVVGASDGSVFGFTAESGKEVGRYGPGPGLSAQPLVFDKGVLFLSNGAALHWLR